MANMKRVSSRHGLATVETAIVLPVILLLTVGLIEYGWLLLKAQ
jgi:Flp pilus assembly protein TadG